MSRYAAIAEDNWRKNTPEEYALIHDKPAFFAELGAEAQRQIDSAVDSALDASPMGEPFALRAKRLLAAQASAEEIVARELLTPPQAAFEALHPTSGLPLPDPETSDDLTLTTALADFPDAITEWGNST